MWKLKAFYKNTGLCMYKCIWLFEENSMWCGVVWYGGLTPKSIGTKFTVLYLWQDMTKSERILLCYPLVAS